MGDFLELGLEAADKIIDKGFDKLPDRIVSPLGADIPKPNFHRNKNGEKYHTPKDKRQNYEDYEEAKSHSRRSATTPANTDDYSRRRRDEHYSDGSDSGYDRDAERRRSRNKDDYGGSRQQLDRYQPNQGYDNQVAVARRPPNPTRRSQSYAPPRHRDRDVDLNDYYSRTPSPLSRAEKALNNPLAAGAIGALIGGALGNQAGKAKADDKKPKGRSRRSKSQSSSIHKPQGGEALLTLAGALAGGVVAAIGSEKYKDFREKRRERKHEVDRNREANVAKGDWERGGHDAESWARSQNSRGAYEEQLREARRWQGQVDAGERERERLHRDDVVVLEERIRPSFYAQQPVYETRRVAERRKVPRGEGRNGRRRSFEDERNGGRWDMDHDSNYGYNRPGDKERETWIASGAR